MACQFRDFMIELNKKEQLTPDKNSKKIFNSFIECILLYEPNIELNEKNKEIITEYISEGIYSFSDEMKNLNKKGLYDDFKLFHKEYV